VPKGFIMVERKMAKISIKDENIQNLQKIQRIIELYDGKETDLDEALARVLALYRTFVPYN